MKKYILKISLALAVSTGFIACEDSLTENPFSTSAPVQVFKDVAGFDNAMRGVYSGFVGRDGQMYGVYLGGDYNIDGDVLADNLILSTEGRLTKRSLFEWIYSANSTSFLYADGYKIIYRANAILENLDNLDEGPVKDNFAGEALMARSLAHFDVVRAYGKIPTQSADANASLGMSIQLSANAFDTPTRNTVGEVYTRIVSDLETAKTLINEDNGLGRFNKNAANALLSRVYLYMGEMQKCIDAANRVTGTVASIASFPDIWNDESNDGVLAKLVISIDDGMDIGTEYSQSQILDDNLPAVPSNLSFRSEYVADFDFYNLYQTNDIRTTTYFYTSAFAGRQQNHIIKHLGKVGQNNNIVDHKTFRMAEVLLNKAEAQAALNLDADALATLDILRVNRYTGFNSPGESGQTLKDAIALERRLELAFEGHRFYDLKRTNQSVVRSAVNGDVADGSGTPAVSTSLPAGDFRFQLPIPQDALNVNENTEQNPGY
jgi:hypothetical protein